MTISKELLDELLKGCERPEDLLGDAGLMKELKIKLMERMFWESPKCRRRLEDKGCCPARPPDRWRFGSIDSSKPPKDRGISIEPDTTPR